jgi:hypothetical protein
MKLNEKDMNWTEIMKNELIINILENLELNNFKILFITFIKSIIRQDIPNLMKSS